MYAPGLALALVNSGQLASAFLCARSLNVDFIDACKALPSATPAVCLTQHPLSKFQANRRCNLGRRELPRRYSSRPGPTSMPQAVFGACAALVPQRVWCRPGVDRARAAERRFDSSGDCDGFATAALSAAGKKC